MTGSDSGVVGQGERVVPVFGLSLPKLPTAERVLAEQRFTREGLEALPRPGWTWGELGEAADAALREFNDRAKFEDAPFAAIRRLGLLALRPSRLEQLKQWQPRPGAVGGIDEILRNLDHIRTLVWSAVEVWQNSARWHPSQEGRRQALVRLRTFTKMLVPDTRGRRKSVGPPPAHLELGYRQLLFRLKLVRELVDNAIPRGRASSAAVTDFAREAGLPEEWVREWLFFSDSLQRIARPQTTERMALELLARIAGMGADSIATLRSRAAAATTSDGGAVPKAGRARTKSPRAARGAKGAGTRGAEPAGTRAEGFATLSRGRRLRSSEKTASR